MKQKLWKRKLKRIYSNGILLVFLCVVIVAIVIMKSEETVSQSVAEEQAIIIENNVRRNAAQCYSIEGVYPDSLEYLQENYRTHYDEENYVVHYQNGGTNILPEIFVFYIGG